MFPILLLAKREEQAQEFIITFQKEHGFSPSFVIEIRPLKTEITIDQIRELKKQLVTSTKEKRLIILYSFDQANTEAQNALLKTLEEKNESNQFILIIKSVDRVLSTIRSRSQIVHSSSEVYVMDIRPETKELLQMITKTEGFVFLSNPLIQSITREDAILLLEELIILMQKEFLIESQSTPHILKKMLLSLSQLQNNNLNPQLAIDNTLIYLKKSYNT